MIAVLGESDTDLSNACVTLWVHAGIAAADVICCAHLGQYSRGQDHSAAVDLLKQVDAKAASHLGRLLGLKTRAGYSPKTIGRSDVLAARRAGEALIELARSL